jgi:hypothetical protein
MLVAVCAGSRVVFLCVLRTVLRQSLLKFMVVVCVGEEYRGPDVAIHCREDFGEPKKDVCRWYRVRSKVCSIFPSKLALLFEKNTAGYFGHYVLVLGVCLLVCVGGCMCCLFAVRRRPL